MTNRTCPICGGPVEGRRSKIFCGEKCNGTAQYRKRLARKSSNATAELARARDPRPADPPTETGLARVLGDGFFLGALTEELETLSRTPTLAAKTRRDLEKEICNALLSSPIWPGERHARAALILWLLSNPKIGFRFHHRHERPVPFGVAPKKTGLRLRRGGYT